MAQRKSSKIVSAWLGTAPDKKTKAASKTSVSNEQMPDGGGDPNATRGGFDPLFGWTTAIGLGTAGIAYAKTQASRTNIPVQKVRGKETWTAQEQSDYYAGQAASLERTVQKMGHPSFYSRASLMNEQDEMFTKIEQIRMMNQADRLRRRANIIARGIPKKK